MIKARRGWHERQASVPLPALLVTVTGRDGLFNSPANEQYKYRLTLASLMISPDPFTRGECRATANFPSILLAENDDNEMSSRIGLNALPYWCSLELTAMRLVAVIIIFRVQKYLLMATD